MEQIDAMYMVAALLGSLSGVARLGMSSSPLTVRNVPFTALWAAMVGACACGAVIEAREDNSPGLIIVASILSGMFITTPAEMTLAAKLFARWFRVKLIKMLGNGHDRNDEPDSEPVTPRPDGDSDPGD